MDRADRENSRTETLAHRRQQCGASPGLQKYFIENHFLKEFTKQFKPFLVLLDKFANKWPKKYGEIYRVYINFRPHVVVTAPEHLEVSDHQSSIFMIFQ